MITPTCPKCRREIPADDINVSKDVAFCRNCNLAHQLSELNRGAELDAGVDFNRPPAGTWYRKDGLGLSIGASHRSLGMAVGTLAVALFWNGIVSVFVSLALASTLQHFGISQPHWFPAPRMNGSAMGVGMTIFLWLFLTPFIAIGLAMIAAFFSALAGRTEVRLGNSNAEGILFTGIGPVGWRRRFDPRNVKDVRIDDQRWRDSDGDRRRKTQIVMETREGKELKLAGSLPEERRKFLAAALRKALLK